LLALFYLSRQKQISKVITAALSVCLVFGLFFVPFIKYFISQIIEGTNAQNTDFGFYNPLRSFIPLTINSIEFIKTTDLNLSLQGLDTKLVGQIAFNGTVLRQSGNSIFVDNINLAIVCIVYIVATLAIIQINKKNNYAFGFILIPNLFIVIAMLFYVFIHLRNAVERNSFSPYVWYRLNSLFVIFSAILIVSIFFQRYSQVIGKKYTIGVFQGIAIILTIYSNFNYFSDYYNNSITAYSIEKCPAINYEETYYIGDTQPAATLGYCGRPLYFLSDSTEKSVKSGSLIYRFQYDELNRKYIEIPFGRFDTQGAIIVPKKCAMDCILAFKDFKEIIK
jgi:hypothetical protein